MVADIVQLTGAEVQTESGLVKHQVQALRRRIHARQ